MKSEERKRMYIEKAFEIVWIEGKDGVSIRRLASELNCNTASLYRCFTDLDELFLYTGLKYLKDYLQDVQDIMSQPLNSIELYLQVWECFITHSFKNPNIYDILFFGHHHKKLGYVIEDYYSLFPEEIVQFDDKMREIFINASFHRRNSLMLHRCVDENIVKEEDMEFLSNLIIQLYKGYLKDLLDETGSVESVETIKKQLMEYYRKIIEGYIIK